VQIVQGEGVAYPVDLRRVDVASDGDDIEAARVLGLAWVRRQPRTGRQRDAAAFGRRDSWPRAQYRSRYNSSADGSVSEVTTKHGLSPSSMTSALSTTRQARDQEPA